MIVDMSPGHRISPSKGGATWQVTITKSAIPKEKTLAGVCLSLLGASPLVPTDTPPPFSSRLSRCSHLDCRAAAISPARRPSLRSRPGHLRRDPARLIVFLLQGTPAPGSGPACADAAQKQTPEPQNRTVRLSTSAFATHIQTVRSQMRLLFGNRQPHRTPRKTAFPIARLMTTAVRASKTF